MTSPNDPSTDSNHHSSELETIGRIAAYAAHDLDNLLQAIVANLELLRERPDMLPTLLEQLLGAVSTASGLTRLLRPSSSSGPSPAAVFDLAKALRSNERFLRNMLPGNIVFRVEAPTPTPLLVRVHPLRFQRAVLNLIVNAADAIGSRGGTIRLLLEEDSPLVARLVVVDDGPGMDEETLRMIQQPLHTTKKDGHGIGLASAREGVRLEGGELRIESAPGRGTRATITLPRVPEPDEALPAPPQSPPRSGAGRRVLVVEDNPYVRQVLAASLGHSGYTPFCAMSGSETMELLGVVDDFVLALVDVSLAGSQDGIQLMDAIRAVAPGLPVVLMSGSDLRDRLEARLADPPDGILRKPFTQADLQELLLRTFERESSTPD